MTQLEAFGDGAHHDPFHIARCSVPRGNRRRPETGPSGRTTPRTERGYHTGTAHPCGEERRGYRLINHPFEGFKWQTI